MIRQDINFWDRRDTEAKWAEKNPILGPGERGFEINTGRFKIGNGHTAWLDLPYFVPAGSVSTELAVHVASPTPHPVYDDLPSLDLLFENGLL